MNEIVILCPFGVETGGPEALHQLSDTLLEIGFDVSMFYTTDTDFETLVSLTGNTTLEAIEIPERKNTINSYSKYNVKPTKYLRFNKDSLIIIPETYIKWHSIFKNNKCLFWWLSVDNAFSQLDMMKLNLNSLKNKNIYHAYQSTYAKNFLNSLGINNAIPLSDYTPINSNIIKCTKSIVSMSALSHKVNIDIDYYKNEIEKYCDIEVKLIRGLSRDEVYEIFDKSYVYIDFGNFPGKDRLPREALIRDCCLITSNAGAAYYNEYTIPNDYIIETASPEFIKYAVYNIISNYEANLKFYEKSKFIVLNERFNFIKEASHLGYLLNS